ncbi:hypothetical protein [Kitasatospora viridis]|uniref:Uncharacterized protein n=1 Tax=Kitasatospora viridis TaxID=281105 RepID=A0A561UPU7_9ACTN|nr:hypothetical protein [Kitasatospora viridis]TWG01354.1 hypothetical protein FHX73_115247 [Kitasatospora viridis]
MPRKPPGVVRATPPEHPGPAPVSHLLIGTCPGPPACAAVHTYLFVDGLDLIERSHSGAVGIPPHLLLSPGGPLYPTDRARTVTVADPPLGSSNSFGVEIRIRMRGGTVIWSDLMYPGADRAPIWEVRFELAHYLTELERAHSRWGNAGGS